LGDQPLSRKPFWKTKRSTAELTVLRQMEKVRLSDSSSALNQINNKDDDRNYEQEMDQAAANVADQAKKPKHDQDDNYSPEHGYSFRLS
jgi:hypothetical protein